MCKARGNMQLLHQCFYATSYYITMHHKTKVRECLKHIAGVLHHQIEARKVYCQYTLFITNWRSLHLLLQGLTPPRIQIYADTHRITLAHQFGNEQSYSTLYHCIYPQHPTLYLSRGGTHICAVYGDVPLKRVTFLQRSPKHR